MKYALQTWKLFTGLFVVLPFVTCVWCYDIITLFLRIVYSKLYIFCYRRSYYLQERELVDDTPDIVKSVVYNN